MAFVKSSAVKPLLYHFFHFSLFKYDVGRTKVKIALSQVKVCKSVLGCFKCCFVYVNTKIENHLTALTVYYIIHFLKTISIMLSYISLGKKELFITK